MKKVKYLQKWIDGYNEVEKAVDEVSVGFDFVKEGLIEESELDALYADAIKKVEDLELRNMLRREEDQLGVVLKINSGAGGTEAQDWASMLMRMYLRWCERNGYKTSIANLLDGDEAGIKSCTTTPRSFYRRSRNQTQCLALIRLALSQLSSLSSSKHTF